MTVNASEPSRRARFGPRPYELLPASWQPKWANIQHELAQPSATWAKRYTIAVLLAILASLLYVFVTDEYPALFPLSSVVVVWTAGFLASVFAIDWLLNLMTTRLRDWRAQGWLLLDLVAIIPSLTVVALHNGWMPHTDLDLLVLLRLLRLVRLFKLLRLSHKLTLALGTSVFWLVFKTMMAHLGLRIAALELGQWLDANPWSWFRQDVLLPGVQAVGAALGISLSITFGIVKRKQMEITELHRSAMDAVAMFEHAIHAIIPQQNPAPTTIDFDGWRLRMDMYMRGGLSYTEIKAESMALLKAIYSTIAVRPSLDSPFHSVPVQKVSQLLTRTQQSFHPVFYGWLRRIAQLYFVSLMMVSPGLTGLAVQMLVIFVFAGLIVIIDDMDHIFSQEPSTFNPQVLSS